MEDLWELEPDVGEHPLWLPGVVCCPFGGVVMHAVPVPVEVWVWFDWDESAVAEELSRLRKPESVSEQVSSPVSCFSLCSVSSAERVWRWWCGMDEW